MVQPKNWLQRIRVAWLIHTEMQEATQCHSICIWAAPFTVHVQLPLKLTRYILHFD